MLLLSLMLLLVAALLGGALAACHLRAGATPSWAPGALHGSLGVAGFIVLLESLTGPPRGVGMGVGGFGYIAAWLCAVALLMGLVLLGARLRRGRVPGLLIGAHASVAISAVVILAAYVLVG